MNCSVVLVVGQLLGFIVGSSGCLVWDGIFGDEDNASDFEDTIIYTTCRVVSDIDSQTVGTFRTDIEAFNGTRGIRICTDLIYFDDGIYGIRLQSALAISNWDDGDCKNDSLPICNDGVGLEVRGPIILDISTLGEQDCAITVNANRVHMREITIISNVGARALCNNGAENDLQVTFKAP